MSILIAPIKEPPFPYLPKIAVTAVISAKEPPIATKPLRISSQDKLPRLANESPNILQALATNIIVIADFIEPSVLSNNFKIPTNSNKPAPIAKRPLSISVNLRAAISTSALLNIFIAIDMAIIAIPALITPLESYLDNDLVNDLKLEESIPNNEPIPIRPFDNSLIFNDAIDFREADNIPMAIAILMSEATFIPEVKDSKDS